MPLLKRSIVLVLLIAPAMLLFHQTSFGQCEIKIAALQGEYMGDCKKGKPHGQGTALGTDKYEGEWKKGVPNGTGTYTWANGDVYVGQWKKGNKDGEGVLTSADGSVISGFWKDDEYFGTSLTPYQITNKSPSVNRIRISKEGNGENIVNFSFLKEGRPVKIERFSLDQNYGLIKNSDFERSFKVTYPCELTTSFEILVGRAASGSGRGDSVAGTTNIQIESEGTWNIEINMNVKN